jgi:hypothetical protein
MERLEEAERLLAQRSERALAAFYSAEAAGADADRCAAGRWMAQMLEGDLHRAWRESDDIRRRGASDPHRFWDGRSIDGRKVIVRCLHGFGDAIQFLRYATRLRARAASLVVEVPPALFGLARYFDGVEKVISWDDCAPAASEGWEIQLEVMELPYLFRTGLSDLPIAEKYLRMPHRLRRAGAGNTSAHLKVGVVWSAGEWNPARSIPFSMVRRLIESSCCEFWNLQGGAARDEWECLTPSIRLRDADACGRGLVNLAATVLDLDLVITVDTLAAHMAGALGKPAWVLLGYAADWRWMTKRDDSPWYPSLRLFRQAIPGDWEGVINCVQRELETSIKVVKQPWRAA